ncbi:transporter suffix domain-containing protein [Chryseobacterium flavum]|uniref:transporter suffix domain-containing protein n=1 Tax=Chryseobacterium flavum TaxID=415851 RepID=UPI0028B204D7|nr:transporter suffix domain-containing protein [Chryseobacterium flavum]
MPKRKLRFKDRLGFFLLGCGIICFIGVPLLSFQDVPDKAATVLTVLIISEIFFLVTIALLR